MQVQTVDRFYQESVARPDASPDALREFASLLWAAHSESIFRYAYSRVRNYQDACDACSETFLRAMRFLQTQPRPPHSRVNFGAWLRAIARNAIVDRARKASNEPLLASDEALASFADGRPPESASIDEEERDALRRCLQELSDRARRMVLMSDVDDVPCRDIALAVGISENAVYVALHRARKALRDCVGARLPLQVAQGG